MARTNVNATRVKPDVSELITLHVVRSERISPSFQRVTLGGGDVERFRPMGYDQWFRLFIPVPGGSLARLPDKLNTIAYLRYLTIAKTSRPVLRNYTVGAYRADGPQLDVDFVIHGSPDHGDAGPAATWAQRCAAGDPVAILDEGIMFNPPPPVDRVRLVADESALPAVAGVLGSLPTAATGHAVIEVPTDDDRRDLRAPAGVEVTWVVRRDHAALPGRAALAAAEALRPTETFHGWVAGEQGLVTAVRRHWIATGVPKSSIMFCGYWKAAH